MTRCALGTGVQTCARSIWAPGFGRAACEIKDLRGIRGARFPMFARDQPSRLAGRQRECVMFLPSLRRFAGWIASNLERRWAGRETVGRSAPGTEDRKSVV